MNNDDFIKSIATSLESINMALYLTKSSGFNKTPSIAQSLEKIAITLESINKSIQENTATLTQLIYK